MPHTEVARKNIQYARYQNKVEVIVGPALGSLSALQERGLPPFDLIFIDSDKLNNTYYLQWALKLAESGAFIIADNVVREGKVGL